MQKFNVKTKWPKEGDIFDVRIRDYRCPGRVVCTMATAFSDASNAVLIYIFSPGSKDSAHTSRREIKTDRLLVPPMVTNKKPWTLHYFRTLANLDFMEDEILDRHRFEFSYHGQHRAYFDEFANEVPDPAEIMGPWGLESYLTIDDTLSAALGVPLAPDD